MLESTNLIDCIVLYLSFWHEVK